MKSISAMSRSAIGAVVLAICLALVACSAATPTPTPSPTATPTPTAAPAMSVGDGCLPKGRICEKPLGTPGAPPTPSAVDNTPTQYIVDIMLEHGDSGGDLSCVESDPSGYGQIRAAEGYVMDRSHDLNAGISDADYVYLCKKFGPREDALTDITVLFSSDKIGIADQAKVCKGSPLSTLATNGVNPNTDSRAENVDMNAGTGGAYIYFCKVRNERPYRLVDIQFNVWNYSPGASRPCSDWGGGWRRAAADENTSSHYGGVYTYSDLNQGSGGKYIYACTKLDPDQGTN